MCLGSGQDLETSQPFHNCGMEVSPGVAQSKDVARNFKGVELRAILKKIYSLEIEFDLVKQCNEGFLIFYFFFI